jgi:alpha-D-ribose 1-methylphosphonate 5-phosphate C-P lyase
VRSLDFEDYPFRLESWDRCCELCGSSTSYLDEIIVNDRGERLFVCSDTDYCARQTEATSQTEHLTKALTE